MKNQNVQDYEYEIYVPVYANGGAAYPEHMLASLREKLVQKFGGITDTRHKNKGVWKIGSTKYVDELIIWRALSIGEGAQDPFMKNLKAEMESSLQQKEILIVKRPVTVIH